MTAPAEFPSRAEGLALHLRLREGDPVAPADLCTRYLAPLLHRLQNKFPHTDPHLRQTAAHDALFNYIQGPEAYDPSLLDLAAYLRMSARGDLLNGLRSHSRGQEGLISLTAVEQDGDGGNIPGAGEEPAVALQRAEDAAHWQAFLQEATAAFSPAERRALDLMLDGRHDYATFAVALGCDGLPEAERNREVKRVKDRIKKRLERGCSDHE
jgi:hypothetical protein